jgi:hypothetical protein
MRIEQPHSLGQAAAISRIDAFLERIVQNPPGGVTVKDARKSWNGSRMSFSFTAARGFFGTTIQGVMDVLDDKVVVESELPALVQSFVGEEKVRRAVADGLGQMLAP